jgi:TPR repeat protein
MTHMSDVHSGREKSNYARRLKEARIGDASAQYDVALMYANGVGVGRNVGQAFTWTKKAAEKGHTAAQYLLAVAYQTGLGTKRNEDAALLWLVRAADNGNERAQLRLSRLLGVSQPSLSFELAMRSAERGLVDAKHAVGVCFDTGSGVETSHPEGFAWHLKSAELGLAAGQYAVGQHLEGKYGGPKDLALALHWYQKAAEQGSPSARIAQERLRSTGAAVPARPRKIQDSLWVHYAEKGSPDDHYHLGLMYQQGIDVECNLTEASRWFERAAALGHPQAQLSLGQSLVVTNPAKATHWLRMAATAGNADAQYMLGNLLMALEGGTMESTLGHRAQGFAWIAAAAKLGHVDALFMMAESVGGATGLEYLGLSAQGGHKKAQFQLGQYYEKGIELGQDFQEAYRWYQLAADQDHADAQCALAGCYARGLGVTQNLAKAFYWYEQSAQKDCPKAQWNLGEMVANGLPGVNRDPKWAAALCKRAATAGFAPAQATMGLLFASAKKTTQAVHWLTLAADQGDLESAYNLYNTLRVGPSSDGSLAKALERLTQAAHGGLAAAQSRLGLVYATGDGTVQDIIEATKWFILASDQGDGPAQANMRKAKSALSAAQWSEAQGRAQRFLKR